MQDGDGPLNSKLVRKDMTQTYFQLNKHDIDLLLGCTIDPLLRERFHDAKQEADDGVCLLGLTESEMHEVYGLLAEILTAEGLDEDGFFNGLGQHVDSIMLALEEGRPDTRYGYGDECRVAV